LAEKQQSNGKQQKKRRKETRKEVNPGRSTSWDSLIFVRKAGMAITKSGVKQRRNGSAEVYGKLKTTS
jgi:hypothetical protein